MALTKSKHTSKDLSKIVALGMQEKKALDIVIMDLRHIPQAFADYFVIASGNSTTQVDAIADSVEEMMYSQAAEAPRHTEGRENKEWILLDYIDVVVHVFRKDRRDFYGLEDLWGDAKTTHIQSNY
jgi:ribosome-associated protein